MSSPGTIKIPCPPTADDGTASHVTATHGEVKRWHKNSVEDLHFVRHRLRKLLDEEQKAIRKLQETSTKTQRIMQGRERNAMRRAEKEAMRQSMFRERMREKQLLTLTRQRDNCAIVAARAKYQLETKERALARRREQAENELSIAAARETQNERARGQTAAIAQRRSQWAACRSKTIESRRQQRFHEEIETSVAALEREREKNTREAASLVAEEARVLQRLLRIRDQNAAAMTQLSGMIGGGSMNVDETQKGSP